jgi:hypothetical protein
VNGYRKIGGLWPRGRDPSRSKNEGKRRRKREIKTDGRDKLLKEPNEKFNPNTPIVSSRGLAVVA